MFNNLSLKTKVFVPGTLKGSGLTDRDMMNDMPRNALAQKECICPIRFAR
jgi:hypothetical protein